MERYRPHRIASNFIQRVYAAGGVGVDALNDNEKYALHELCWYFETSGLLPLLIAYYPFVGGRGTTQSITNFTHNLISSSFQLTPVNVTASMCTSTGYKGNGTNSYWNTNITPSINGNYSVYIGSNEITSGGNFCNEIGSWDNIGQSLNALSIVLGNGNNNSSYHMGPYAGGSVFLTLPSVTILGFHSMDSLADTTLTAYRNGVNIGSVSGTTTRSNPYLLYLGALNIAGTASRFSPRRYCSFSIGSGLNSSLQAIRFQIEQNFQTRLNREINFG